MDINKVYHARNDFLNTIYDTTMEILHKADPLIQLLPEDTLFNWGYASLFIWSPDDGDKRWDILITSDDIEVWIGENKWEMVGDNFKSIEDVLGCTRFWDYIGGQVVSE